MNVRGVLFDKDGTLISFEKTWGPAIAAVIRTLARGDARKVAAQAAALQFSMDDMQFLPTSPIIAGSTGHYGMAWAMALGRFDLLNLKAEIDALTAVESLKSLTPIGEPVAVVEALKARGLAVGVATNDSEASARRQIAALSLLERLDFIAGYDSGHGAKPDPGMIYAFARRIGCAPAEIAMVGDTLHDLDAARSAGAIAVAVLSGPGPRAALERRADYVLEDISGLPALVSPLAP